MGARFSTSVQTGPGVHPASCTMGTGSFSGLNSGQGVTLTPHPLLVPWSRKGRSTPLLLLWAVRPLQSLSACIRVHFTSTFLYVIVQCCKNNPCGENLHCGDPLTVQPSKIVQTLTPPASSDSLVSSHYHSDSTRRISCHMKCCVVLRNP